METRIRTIRQGDLLFVPGEIPAYVLEHEPDKKGVIAEGEATGHHHRLATVEDAQVFRVSDGVYVKVEANGVSIVHEEHHPVRLEPNTTYKVNRARECDYLAQAARYIAD